MLWWIVFFVLSVLCDIKICLAFGAFLSHQNEAAPNAYRFGAEGLGLMSAPAACCLDTLNLTTLVVLQFR
jgi:hypothetical protein